MNTPQSVDLKELVLKGKGNDMLLKVPEQNLDALIDLIALLLRKHRRYSFLAMGLIDALNGDSTHRTKDKAVINYLCQVNRTRADLQKELTAFIKFLDVNKKSDDLEFVFDFEDDIPF